MNLNHKQWVLIQRYVTGVAKPEEQKLIKLWMNQNPENKQLIRELEEVWNLTPDENFDVDVQDAWERFRDRHGKVQADRVKSIGYPPRRASRLPLYFLRAAAVILVSLFTGFFMQSYLSESDSEQVSNFYVMENFETDKGEKARITFSDGTQVILNSASSLRFPKEFRGSKREVHLEGEAFFEVAPDKDHPFIVYSQGAEIRVLGTEFNVRGWSEDLAVEIAVREGSVAVSSLYEELAVPPKVILTEGFYTSVAKGESPAPAQRVDVTNYLLWTHGGLHFESTPFSQVKRDIERRFNVTIANVSEHLTEIPYTGTFQYAELDEVLTVIAASMGIEYRREGSEIEFK